MIVADTDVLIDYLAGHGAAADRVAFELAHGGLATTTISRFELLAGARTTKQEFLVGTLLEALDSLPLDDAAASEAARIRRTLGRAGTPIGMGDSLIAGIVVSRRALLLTRSRRHFEQIEGLSLATLTLS